MKLTHLVMIIAVTATPAVVQGQARSARPAVPQPAKPAIQVFEGAG